jgi:hypothetical protein
MVRVVAAWPQAAVPPEPADSAALPVPVRRRAFAAAAMPRRQAASARAGRRPESGGGGLPENAPHTADLYLQAG